MLTEKDFWYGGGDLYWVFNLMQILTQDRIPATSPLLNLRKVYARMRNYDEKEIAVLVWFLGNSPAIETMDFLVPPR